MQHIVHAVPAPGRFSKRAVGLLLAGLLQAGLIWALIAGLDIKVLGTHYTPPIGVIFPRSTVKPPPVPPDLPVVEPTKVQVVEPAVVFDTGETDTGAINPSHGETHVTAAPGDHGPVSLRATHTIPPYPPLEARLGAEGTVLLRLVIEPNGTVSDAQVIRSSGAEGLDRAARLWVIAHWRYQPAIRDGAAVPSAVDVAVKFNLRTAG